MPAVPRQGRKGGKISAATPGTLPTSGSETPVAAATSPGSIPNPSVDAVLEFDLRALIDNKRSAISTLATAAVSGIPPASDENLLKFDLEAIKEIGQGVVVGRNRVVHTEYLKPETSFEEVDWAVKGILDEESSATAEAISLTEIEKVSSREVTVVRRPHTAMTIALALCTRVKDAKILIVLSHRQHIASIAASLRTSLQRHCTGEAGVAVTAVPEVGELSDQFYVGGQGCNLWVTDAATALMYLHSQKSLAPFTHAVLPGMSPTTPLESYLMWALRERVFRRSANLDVTAPPLHVVTHSSGRRTAMLEYFQEQEAAFAAEMDEPTKRTEFSYDAAHALAKMEVLDVAVDKSGKFPGPHPRLVEHAIKVATKIITGILSDAKSNQTIYVLTAHSGRMCGALGAANLKDTRVIAGRGSEEDMQDEDESSTKHRVFVMHTLLGLLDGSDESINFILDMGTVHRLTVHSKSENFLESHTTEWASKDEIAERKDIVGISRRGAYFALYPPAAEAVFSEKYVSSDSLSLIDGALLECLRAELPTALATRQMVSPIEADTLEQGLYNLAEKCFAANTSGSGITFVGEIASRMPLRLDLAHFVINGCGIGLGEAAVAVAAMAGNWGPRGAKTPEALAHIASCRTKYAGECIATQSDLLADTIVFLEWLKRTMKQESCEEIIGPCGVQRKEHLAKGQTLLETLRQQLSDYAFVDDFRDGAEVDAVISMIKDNATILIFLLSVALVRCTAFVRDPGSISAQDRSAAFSFVRSSKRVAENPAFPSLVKWEMGAALVPLRLDTSSNIATTPGNTVLAANLSQLNTSYFFASLLLLNPLVEYSAPTEVAGKGRVVYFGVTCNRQMKRFSVGIEDAASVLDFRSKWNQALGYLKALRTTRRPISRRRFEMLLKEKDHLFSLENFHKSLQRDFLQLATEIDVTEHQSSFTTSKAHFLTADDMTDPSPTATSSDLAVAKMFHDGDLWESKVSVGKQPLKTPSTAYATSPPTITFPSTVAGGAFYEDDEDEVEVIAESFFVKYGPIIIDDDSDAE